MYYIKLYKQVIACNVWFDNHIKTIFKVKCRAIKYQRCGLDIDIMYLHQMNRLAIYFESKYDFEIFINVNIRITMYIGFLAPGVM